MLTFFLAAALAQDAPEPWRVEGRSLYVWEKSPPADLLRFCAEKKVARLESGPTMLPLFAIGLNTTARDLKREVLGAERRAIVEMRAQQRIGTELFQRLMADLDVEELKSAE